MPSRIFLKAVHRSGYIFLGLGLWILSALFHQCGQPMPPTGGLKDTLPPVLVKSTPPDSGLNFKGNRITLEFNEFVQLQNAQQQLVFSPVPKINPQVESKLKIVTVKIKDTLEPNTTYSINFGNAIQDINESNALKKFVFVFSTGPSVDSGSLSGRVVMAESGKVDSTIIVLLQRDLDDSAVAKKRPRYIARLNKDGYFSFRYIHAGTYNVFALRDADGQMKYDMPGEAIAFLDKPVDITSSTLPVKLYAFSDIPEKPKPATSTGGAPKPAAGKDDKRLRYINNLDGGTLDVLGDLILQFDRKPTMFDSARIRLCNEKNERLSSYSLTLDSNRLNIRYAWQLGTKYHLLVDKDLAADSLGNKVIRNDTLKFETKKESDYGSLTIRLSNLDTSLHPVLLFYKGDELKKADPILTGRMVYKRILPLEYDLRILFDRNRNGKWDTGDYWKKLQPEIVKPRTQKLNIRANWDNEIDINIREVLTQE